MARVGTLIRLELKIFTKRQYDTDRGKGYLTDSGYWVNRDLCEADRKANFLVRSEWRKRKAQKS